MAAITINREKYRTRKSDRDWLARFMDEQIKTSEQTTKKIGEKEVTTTKTAINPERLFALAAANGFELAKIKESVEAGQQGAVGRARMILTGCLKRKMVKDGKLFDCDGDEIEIDGEYLASITPQPKAEAEAGDAA